MPLVSRQLAGYRTRAFQPCQQKPMQLQAQKARMPEVRTAVAWPALGTSLHTTHAPLTPTSLCLSGLRLQQAAEQLLPSSSSDSEPEEASDQPFIKVASPHGQAVQVADTDSSSDESPHRKHKRRREHSKHKKHRKSRCQSGSEDADPFVHDDASHRHVHMQSTCAYA